MPEASPRRVELVRRLAASRERLYVCFTEARELARWFGPGEVCVRAAELDVRVGGRYRIEFLSPDGAVDVVRGEYLEVKPPERLRFTWVWEVWRDGPVDEETVVTVDLRVCDGGAELRVVHEHFGDEEGRRLHAEGWERTIDCLETLIERGEDPAAGG